MGSQVSSILGLESPRKEHRGAGGLGAGVPELAEVKPEPRVLGRGLAGTPDIVVKELGLGRVTSSCVVRLVILVVSLPICRSCDYATVNFASRQDYRLVGRCYDLESDCLPQFLDFEP